jgi:plasmid stability protein
MAQLLVRELDEDVIVSLKARAKRRHRSLEGEVRSILTDLVHEDRRREQFLRELEALRTDLASQPQTDSVELLREARAEWDEKWDRS